MHWSELNCLSNPQIPRVSPSNFYISENASAELILPKNITCEVYHPVTCDSSPPVLTDVATVMAIREFIRKNDCIDNQNTTEFSIDSFNRFISMPCFVGILFNSDRSILGTIFTMILRAYHPKQGEFLTSYTTFLCVERTHREKGLAMILIRAIMKEGERRYNMCHGYYMTPNVHHSINSPLQPWYRPLNVKRALDSGFTLEAFEKKGDRSTARQKLAYHVRKPNILPRKVKPQDYERVLSILQKGKIYLKPSAEEFPRLMICFDIYIVGNDSLFMLFPMSSIISSTGKQINNAQLALMIGDVFHQALWVANAEKYDLLYGWCAGDITSEIVKRERGLITQQKTYLEFYNTAEIIPNESFSLPLF